MAILDSSSQYKVGFGFGLEDPSADTSMDSSETQHNAKRIV
ncbi:MAG: hypothetical protein ACRYGR_05770 [Janthinobacterium lividum]